MFLNDKKEGIVAHELLERKLFKGQYIIKGKKNEEVNKKMN